MHRARFAPSSNHRDQNACSTRNVHFAYSRRAVATKIFQVRRYTPGAVIMSHSNLTISMHSLDNIREESINILFDRCATSNGLRCLVTRSREREHTFSRGQVDKRLSTEICFFAGSEEQSLTARMDMVASLGWHR